VDSEVVERRLAAILSADAVGYSRLMSRDEEATLRTLKAHLDAMDGLIRQHGGRIVDAVGDNLLAIGSPGRASTSLRDSRRSRIPVASRSPGRCSSRSRASSR
jgi:class 3 adenylate cyclase